MFDWYWSLQSFEVAFEVVTNKDLSQICIDHYKVLKSHLKWSLQRLKSHLKCLLQNGQVTFEVANTMT